LQSPRLRISSHWLILSYRRIRFHLHCTAHIIASWQIAEALLAKATAARQGVAVPPHPLSVSSQVPPKVFVRNLDVKAMVQYDSPLDRTVEGGLPLGACLLNNPCQVVNISNLSLVLRSSDAARCRQHERRGAGFNQHIIRVASHSHHRPFCRLI
jgi:hypothetical protein